MKYHGNWNLAELYSLPVQIRNWFAHQLSEQIKMENEAIENSKKGGR
mgnify:CR=1 FL=1